MYAGQLNEFFLAAAEHGDVNVIKKILAHSCVDANSIAIDLAARAGHVEVVRLLLKDGRINPGADDNYAIRWAARRGHTEVVRLLLEDGRVDPTDVNDEAIRLAIQKGHVEIVKLLIEHGCDPDDSNSIATAAERGHTDMVKLLLHYVSPRAIDIGTVVADGYTEIVRLLLDDEQFDPCVESNVALRTAIAYDHAEILEMLMADPRVKPYVSVKLPNIFVFLPNPIGPNAMNMIIKNNYPLFHSCLELIQ